MPPRGPRGVSDFFGGSISPKIAPRGPGCGGLNLIFLPEFLFILVRSPCKNLNSNVNAIWDFNNGGKNSGGYEKKIQEAMRRRIL
jgi:hypothetical protein